MFSSLLRKQPKKQQAAPPISLTIEGQEITVHMRNNPRARRLILRRAGQKNHFNITLPPGCSHDHALEFALKNSKWIADQIHKAPAPEPITHGSLFPLRGMMHKVHHRPNARGVVWMEEAAHDEEAQLVCVTGKEDHIERRVKDWVKKQARIDLTTAAQKYAAQLDVDYARVTLRDTTSRWGSCSSQGNLSFSWRLILAPSNVLDYVAAHEVAHLIELNHSKSFWDIVEKLDPNYRAHTKWLKENGKTLHQYFS